MFKDQSLVQMRVFNGQLGVELCVGCKGWYLGFVVTKSLSLLGSLEWESEVTQCLIQGYIYWFIECECTFLEGECLFLEGEFKEDFTIIEFFSGLIYYLAFAQCFNYLFYLARNDDASFFSALISFLISALISFLFSVLTSFPYLSFLKPTFPASSFSQCELEFLNLCSVLIKFLSPSLTSALSILFYALTCIVSQVLANISLAYFWVNERSSLIFNPVVSFRFQYQTNTFQCKFLSGDALFGSIFFSYIEIFKAFFAFYPIVSSFFGQRISFLPMGFLFTNYFSSSFYLFLLLFQFFSLIKTAGNLMLFQVNGDKFRPYEAVAIFLLSDEWIDEGKF